MDAKCFIIKPSNEFSYVFEVFNLDVKSCSMLVYMLGYANVGRFS